ncbi:radical SAM protein [Candidatus Beckwithbacteria bacterium CG10_big_fil_rev_8_21_14_0_10_34_10]|uniref:Radical SAM protein n=1 Tax=Candidatus Beckwithbacteria bacterium CG10_big_fil_rev_8_21_14_0_10_34_10 TaxID=1974495 RepID=A0A2H0W9X2_9BACT|nr:MAG: radical SAM protein [Candidatus Beckwithbacteria bacterium CG10_big_fil_rev_8_21_14_0_10_34_10]
MKIKEIQVKSVLVKSNLPESDFVINPYLGCLNTCAYCYARFMKRFTGHKEPWGSFVDVKINALEILEKELKKFKGVRKKYSLCLSSVTDPYQKVEEKFKLTRGILELLVEYPCFEVEIITKSDLVLRDLDILGNIRKKKVVLSLGVLEDDKAKWIEPNASLPSQRIKALEKIKAEDIKTSAFISPILPFITDLDLIFRALKGKVDEVFGETFNRRGANFTNLAKVLKAKFPGVLEEYKRLYFSNEYKDYLRKTKKEFYEKAKKHRLPVWGFFTH